MSRDVCKTTQMEEKQDSDLCEAGDIDCDRTQSIGQIPFTLGDSSSLL